MHLLFTLAEKRFGGQEKKMLLLQFNGPHCQMVSKNLRTEWLI